MLAAGLLALLILRSARPRRPARPASAVPSILTASPAPSRSELALHAAWHSCIDADLAVSSAREDLEAWDGGASHSAAATAADGGDAVWYRAVPAAADDLRRARITALRAQALARTPDEAYRAAELLILIDHELGRHDRELQAARRLVALRPRSQRALSILRRAAACRGQSRLQHWAARQLAQLQKAPTPAPPLLRPP